MEDKKNLPQVIYMRPILVILRSPPTFTVVQRMCSIQFTSWRREMSSVQLALAPVSNWYLPEEGGNERCGFSDVLK